MILRPEDSLADEFNIYVYNTNFATCAHNRLFSTLLIGTDGKYRQHCSINKVLMSIGHIISYMYFLFTICSATRISWQNERIDVAPNTTNYCTTSNGAHSKNEHHWEQFDGEGKKNKWRDWRKKVRASIRSLYTLLQVSFTYVYVY